MGQLPKDVYKRFVLKCKLSILYPCHVVIVPQSVAPLRRIYSSNGSVSVTASSYECRALVLEKPVRREFHAAARPTRRPLGRCMYGVPRARASCEREKVHKGFVSRYVPNTKANPNAHLVRSKLEKVNFCEMQQSCGRGVLIVFQVV